MLKLVTLILTAFILFTSTTLAVDVLNNACNQVPNSTVCQDQANQNHDNKNPINHYIHVATDIVAVLVGLAAVIMIIISGFKFVTGGGNQQSIVSARNTLLWAVIGLAVAALAWTLINFAVDKLITT